MSGRRNRARITFLNSDGMLRISRDVVIKKAAENEFVALSSEPSGPGDVLTITFSTEDRRQTDRVRVIGRRPVVVDGVLKYTDVGQGHYHFNGSHQSWDTTQLAEGSHALRLTVYDASNRTDAGSSEGGSAGSDGNGGVGGSLLIFDASARGSVPEYHDPSAF